MADPVSITPICPSIYLTENACGSRLVHRCRFPVGHAGEHETRWAAGFHNRWSDSDAVRAQEHLIALAREIDEAIR